MVFPSIISNAHPSYIESLYRDFQQDPDAIDQEWRKFFEGFEFALSDAAPGALRAGDISLKELHVFKYIIAYRERGHLLSNTNPLKPRKDRQPGLTLDHYGLSEEDLDTPFLAGVEIGLPNGTLREIQARLHQIYSRTIGFEFSYIVNKDERLWFKEKVEKGYLDYELPLEKKKRVLKKLNDSAIYEKFLGTKFIGQKRFSLEGGESTIPALDAIINKGAELGVDEVVFGMAHRGRLNVLTNILRKTYEEVFSEFQGVKPGDLYSATGDVKYHLGFSSMYESPSGKEVYLKLLPNPSHLEAINPVVQGYCRSKADTLYDSEYSRILPVTIHGDAAIAGQGITYEVLQMSQLKGYRVAGTIHFVINNQIGFTTDFDDARSSNYCTSLAASVQAPVIHVNGDDVEAVVFAVELAVEYRQQFGKDVFVDMVCYRKFGHNEGDDPQYTQPHLYKLIKNHPSVRDIYFKKLHESGQVNDNLASEYEEKFWKELQDRLNEMKQIPRQYKLQLNNIEWRKLRKAKAEDFESSPDTAIPKSRIVTVVKGLIKVPEGFSPLRKVQKMLDDRRAIMRKNATVDWAAAELLAYGSVLLDKIDVRLSGEDVKRGTFSHRHATIYDEHTNEEYNRLDHLVDYEKQGRFRVYNSLLSEYGVLGFEFGYSLPNPNVLVLWEAQFGDFANGAQVIIDQFIASGESKWDRMSSLVLLLPHGYEGAGPEHSSARLERFLQSCAEYNMVVCNITTPANFFHALRRQLAWPFRKPLVIMTPKSLLRHPRCVSDISEIYKGKFMEIIDDADTLAPEKVNKVLFCSGKVYYDLLAHKEAHNHRDVAIVRLEQLYPLVDSTMTKLVKKYKNASYYWVQEEPANMGAWAYINSLATKTKLELISRVPAASPATGFAKVHEKEQQEIVDKAFA